MKINCFDGAAFNLSDSGVESSVDSPLDPKRRILPVQSIVLSVELSGHSNM